jgi:crossover junction endodeoxyribonuclease RusA
VLADRKGDALMLGTLPFAPKTLRVVMPWPDPKLNPNRSKGLHWAATSSARAKQKSDARSLALQQMRVDAYVPPPGTLALTITFVQPDRRARDRDNLLAASKGLLDGLSQALGVDDQHFDPVTIRRKFGAKPGSVIVEVSHAV